MAAVWANATVAYKWVLDALDGLVGVTLAMPGEIDPDIQSAGAIARIASLRVEHAPRNAADGESDEARLTLVVAVITRMQLADPRDAGDVYQPMQHAELVASALDQLHRSDTEHDLCLLRPTIELVAAVDEELGAVISTVTITGSLTRSSGSSLL